MHTKMCTPPPRPGVWKAARLVAGAVAAVGLAATANGAELTLDWVDNAGGTAAFVIERRTGTAGEFAQIAATAAGVTTYVDATVTPGTTFCYRVRATNAGGTSD
jgi:hypothetical protein